MAFLAPGAHAPLTSPWHGPGRNNAIGVSNFFFIADNIIERKQLVIITI